jgi:hypothetical protein
MSDTIPFRVRPMLATLAAKPFDKPGWVFEEKYDGDRILAYKEDDPRPAVVQKRQGSHGALSRGIVAAQSPALASPDPVCSTAKWSCSTGTGVSRVSAAAARRHAEPVYAVVRLPVFTMARICGANRSPGAPRGDGDCHRCSRDASLLPSHRLADKRPRGISNRAAPGAMKASWSRRICPPRTWKRARTKLAESESSSGRGVRDLRISRNRPARANILARCSSAPFDKDQLHYVGKVGTGFDAKRRSRLFTDNFKPLVRLAIRNWLTHPREPKKAVIFIAPQARRANCISGMDRGPQAPPARVYLGLRDDKSARDVLLPEAAP